MDQFVCVRLVRGQDFDLSLFQFDLDQSFAVFFLNADKTIYGRYGTRSDFHEAERDISLEGLRKAMATALVWHQNLAKYEEQLAAKRGPRPKYASFDRIPTRQEGRRFRAFRGGCTHCHDIRTARQFAYFDAGQPIPEKELFPWPLPDAAGWGLDPKEKATVRKIWEKSPAQRAGFRVGDEIIHLAGQPILSLADVQWVLHQAKSEDVLLAEIRRDGKMLNIDITLDKGWRRNANISWRPSTRVLRRRFLSRIRFQDLTPAERDKLGLSRTKLALETGLVISKSSGFQRGDVVLAVDGQQAYMSEGDLIAYIAQEKHAGDSVKFTLLRAGERVEVTLPIN